MTRTTQKCARLSAYRAAGVLTASALALAVAGCSNGPGRHSGLTTDTYHMGTVVPDYKQRHPILVSEAPVFLEVDVARGSSGLHHTQRADIDNFITDYARESGGAGPLIIAAPSGSGNEGAAMRVANAVKHVAVARGISPGSIAMEPYSASGYAAAPVKVSYHQTIAKGPECGLWPGNLRESSRNTNYHNFGCAMQQNVAAMVANPNDLLGQRTLGQRAGARRDVVWDAYLKGETTAAERSQDEKSGNISEVGN